MKEGQIRIVRADKDNFAVEKVVLVETREKKDGKLVKTGQDELRWVNQGFFGRKLQWAFNAVILASMSDGQELDIGALRSAYDAMLASMSTLKDE